MNDAQGNLQKKSIFHPGLPSQRKALKTFLTDNKDRIADNKRTTRGREDQAWTMSGPCLLKDFPTVRPKMYLKHKRLVIHQSQFGWSLPHVGQRVEVLWNDGIYQGTIRFKGVIATKKGDWVGVALDFPDGDTSGMLFGRRYFQCLPNHGIFVRADRIRFIPSIRCLYDKYHKVSNTSYVDEFLFDTPRPPVKNGPYDPINLSVHDLQRAKSSLGDYVSESVWEKPKYFSLRHSVGNLIPAATMLRGQKGITPFRYSSSPVHVDYWKDEDFERKPSIPKTHMPHSALIQQVRRGWDGAHYVREMTVPTGKDKMKMSQWNDISP